MHLSYTPIIKQSYLLTYLFNVIGSSGKPVMRSVASVCLSVAVCALVFLKLLPKFIFGMLVYLRNI